MVSRGVVRLGGLLRRGRLRNGSRRRIGVENVDGAFPTAVSLLFPNFSEFAVFVDGGASFGVFGGFCVGAVDVAEVAGARGFGFGGGPGKRGARREHGVPNIADGFFVGGHGRVGREDDGVVGIEGDRAVEIVFGGGGGPFGVEVLEGRGVFGAVVGSYRGAGSDGESGEDR